MSNGYFSNYESPNIVIVPTVPFIKAPEINREISGVERNAINTDKNGHGVNLQAQNNTRAVLEPNSALHRTTITLNTHKTSLSDASNANVSKKCVVLEHKLSASQETERKLIGTAQNLNKNSEGLDVSVKTPETSVVKNSWATDYLQSIGLHVKPIKLNLTSSTHRLINKFENLTGNIVQTQDNIPNHSTVDRSAKKKSNLVLHTSRASSISCNQTTIGADLKPPLLYETQNTLVTRNLITLTNSDTHLVNNNNSNPQSFSTEASPLNNNIILAPVHITKNGESIKNISKTNRDKNKSSINETIKRKLISNSNKISNESVNNKEICLGKNIIKNKNIGVSLNNSKHVKLPQHTMDTTLTPRKDHSEYFKPSTSKTEALTKSDKKRVFEKTVLEMKTRAKLDDTKKHTEPKLQTPKKDKSNRENNITEKDKKNSKLNQEEPYYSLKLKKFTSLNSDKKKFTDSQSTKNKCNKCSEDPKKIRLHLKSDEIKKLSESNKLSNPMHTEVPQKKNCHGDVENKHINRLEKTKLRSSHSQLKRPRQHSESTDVINSSLEKSASLDAPPIKRFRAYTESANKDDSLNKKVNATKSKVKLPDILQKTLSRIQPPENDNSNVEDESNFDLGSRLKRRRMSFKHYSKDKLLVNIDESETKTRKTGAENVVNDDLINEGKRTQSPTPGPSKPKPKSKKKYRKMQIVINVMCKKSDDESESSSSDDTNSTDGEENRTTRNFDLSFLDDFNIEEIVNSLKNTPKSDCDKQATKKTTTIDSINILKQSQKASTNDSAQPIFIKTQMKSEPCEMIEFDNSPNNNSNEVCNEKAEANSMIGVDEGSLNDINSNQPSFSIDVDNKIQPEATIKINDNEAECKTRVMKQEKEDSQVEINIDDHITENENKILQDLHNDVTETVDQLIFAVLSEIETTNDQVCLKTEEEFKQVCQDDNILEQITENENKILQDLHNDVTETVDQLIFAVLSEIETTNDQVYLKTEEEFKQVCQDDNILEQNTLNSDKVTEKDIEIVESELNILKTETKTTEIASLEVKNVCEVPVTENELDENKSLCKVKHQEENKEIKVSGKQNIPCTEKIVKEVISLKTREASSGETQKKTIEKTQQSVKVNSNLRKNNNADTKTLKISALSTVNRVLASKIETRIFDYMEKRLTVVCLIHQGRYSKVFKCQDAKGVNYAVKIIKSECHRESLGIRKEAMLMTIQRDIPIEKLNTIYFINGFGLERNWCFLMEYYPKNLQEVLIERKKPFHIDDVQNLTRQLLSALMVLRNNNIVHSDIKPPHILLDSSNKKLKLCGFDGANYVNCIEVLPNIGTLSYRAPEIILGYSAGFSIDVWASALIIYEMATADRLFKGIYNNDILFKQMCLLGNMPMDLVLGSPYALKHFIGQAFMRRTGHMGQRVTFIHKFLKTNDISSLLSAAYEKFWRKNRTDLQLAEDMYKFDALHRLLEQMLVLDPKFRLAIEFVYVNPFVLWM